MHTQTLFGLTRQTSKQTSKQTKAAQAIKAAWEYLQLPTKRPTWLSRRTFSFSTEQFESTMNEPFKLFGFSFFFVKYSNVNPFYGHSCTRQQWLREVLDATPKPHCFGHAGTRRNFSKMHECIPTFSECMESLNHRFMVRPENCRTGLFFIQPQNILVCNGCSSPFWRPSERKTE